MGKKKYDFGGYATKVNVVCTDGRTIMPDAFKHMNGQRVPLIWQHDYNSPANVVGHAILEHRDDGIYAYGLFNGTENGVTAKELVEHGDITSLSIHANNLKQNGKAVVHGHIREVSLVLAGANPGAQIDNLCIMHGDSVETVDDEALIYSGELLQLEHADEGDGGETVKEVFDSFTDKQKDVIYAMLAHVAGKEDEDEDEDADGDVTHSDQGGNVMKRNVFEEQAANKKTLTHAEFGVIMADAQKLGSFKEAVLLHAVDYGIENIDYLFPDAQTLKRDPEWLQRETGWVSTVLAAISKSPFSRVKSLFADMDIATARAKGYITATEKKEVYFKMAKRVTTPTTVYVKQKLDRDDIIDVVDFDAVAMVRFQLRTLLEEELAMAALLGDGRDVSDPYKINEENIRPIWTEDDLFCVKETVSTKSDWKKLVKEIALTHKNYKGSGAPVFFTTTDVHTNMLWIEDNNGRRIYESDATLCAALRVSAIVEVPHMEGKTRTVEGKVRDLIGIKVNLKDYNFGADKGGQVATFDDFDIDFNQYKYLMETRCSGALTKAKSAQVFEFVNP